MSQLMTSDCVQFDLRPFAHQVGGHTCVLELSDTTICKPFCDKEVWFYLSKPEELKEFVPRYIGEVDVFCDIQKRHKRLKAFVPKTLAQSTGLSPDVDGQNLTTINRKRFLHGRFGSGCTLSSRPWKRRRDGGGHSNTENQTDLELWSIQCIDRQIQRKGFWANNQPQKFILLENLVWDYRYPCLMDMKMGTRQYGEDSDADKRKLLSDRCANSTSSTLGLRVCGMQVFQNTSRTYIKHDKYVGRGLDDAGVARELQCFFQSGTCLRRDVISLILEKLVRLRRVLEEQNLFFFFSCSLLLTYDGFCPTFEQQQTTINTSCSDVTDSAGNVAKPDQNKSRDHDRSLDLANSYDQDKMPSGETRVDVRLIDFAHVCSKQEVVSDANSDEGILFGLDSLILVLRTLL